MRADRRFCKPLHNSLGQACVIMFSLDPDGSHSMRELKKPVPAIRHEDNASTGLHMCRAGASDHSQGFGLLGHACREMELLRLRNCCAHEYILERLRWQTPPEENRQNKTCTCRAQVVCSRLSKPAPSKRGLWPN